MVTITKNGKRRKVPKEAFQNFYKNAGWRISDTVQPSSGREKIPAQEVPEEEVPEEEVATDEWDEAEEGNLLGDGVEKPIAQMNHQELLDKALSLGIGVSGNPSSKQLRELIRKNA